MGISKTAEQQIDTLREEIRRRRKERRKTALCVPILRGAHESRVVTDPAHVPKHPAREPGGPAFSQSGRCPGTHREV